MGMFNLAIREKLNLRMALVGPSGSGKTLTALKIAKGLAGDNGKIAVIDSERGSARRFANLVEFYVVELDYYSPDRYIKAIKGAEAEGFTVLLIDSLSHAWNKKGGILEMVDKAAEASKSGNKFTAWADATPKHNALVDAILDAKLHVIVTMRCKTEYLVETNERGKNVPRKVGTTPIQRDELEYEFDIAADMDLEHNLTFSKSRCIALDGQTIVRPDENLGTMLKAWADEGIEPMGRAQQAQPTVSRWQDDEEQMLGLKTSINKHIFKSENADGVLERALALLGLADFNSFATRKEAWDAVDAAYTASLPPATPVNSNAPAPQDELDAHFKPAPFDGTELARLVTFMHKDALHAKRNVAKMLTEDRLTPEMSLREAAVRVFIDRCENLQLRMTDQICTVADIPNLATHFDEKLADKLFEAWQNVKAWDKDLQAKSTGMSDSNPLKATVEAGEAK